MLSQEKREPITNELQREWLRYLNLMITTNTIHCSKTELDTFYNVWESDSYSYSDAVVLNHLLKKHPLKKLKNLTNGNNGSESQKINFK